MAKKCHRNRLIAGEENFMGLSIRQPQRKIILKFYRKPPGELRGYIRVLNFRWSRKYHYWHGWYGTKRAEQIKKLYHLIERSNIRN